MLTSTLPAPAPETSTRIEPLLETWLEKLARGLHRFGTPAHRLEEALEEAAARRGLEAQVFSTPTAIFLALGRPGSQQTRLMRLPPGEVNLEKLSLLEAELPRHAPEATANEAAGIGRSLQAAVEPIDEIVEAPDRYGPWPTTAAFALAAGAAARFFGGSAQDIAAAAGIGLGIGLLALAMQKLPRSRRLFEPIAAIGAAGLATWAATAIGASPLVTTLSGLIVLVPGLTLTTAMTELATGHLVSGSARLAGALLTFVTIGFGVAVGSRAGALLFPATAPVQGQLSLPLWTEGAAMLVAALAFVVLFRAAPRDSGWVLASASVAYLGARSGAAALGPELGALFGALVLGIGSNLHARWLHRPAALTQVPGLMLLVPGSLGFRSVAALVEHDTLSGVQTAFTMVLVAIALVTGLLLANVLVPTRKAL